MVHHALLHPQGLRTEYLIDPIGLDELLPRFSWTLHSAARAQLQSAYRITVSRTVEGLGDGPGLVWDSGVQASRQQNQIVYAGRPLESRTRYFWTVEVWGSNSSESVVSDIAHWETGLLNPREWSAQWISLSRAATGTMKAPELDDPRSWRAYFLKRPARFKREFDIAKPITAARAYVTARGVYELYANGARVGDTLLSPGWTDYDQRIDYEVLDLTAMLSVGTNAVGVHLGSGWYAGYIGVDPFKPGALYGTTPQALVQVIVDHPDGTSTTIVSDDSWRCQPSHLIYSDLLMGEWSDLRDAEPGWSLPDARAAGWHPVDVQPRGNGVLSGMRAEPVRVTAERSAVSMTETAPGCFVYDFGQNAAGRVSLTARGVEPGRRVRLRFGEVCSADGALYTDNLRTAEATDYVTFAGDAQETYQPTFTFHGFRFVEITGLDSAPAREDVVMQVMNTDCERVGSFDSSSPLVNRLASNIAWGQRSNFLAVPTDCPQRDERLGWAGDAQVFSTTATYNMDIAAFFTKYVDDLVDAQYDNGYYPDLAPSRPSSMMNGAPGWSDAGVLLPWELYLAYGDVRVLERNWASMRRFVDALVADNPSLLRIEGNGEDFGDWLSVDADTDHGVLATAFMAHDADLMGRIGRIIGKSAEAARYERLSRDISAAFVAEYIDGSGRVRSDTQTAYLLSLAFIALPPALEAAAVERLVADIRARRSLSTGFLGVRHLCPILSRYWHDDVAYDLLLNEEYPSWGFSVVHGATTIWERWNGWTEDIGFQSPFMNSFNHYSLGSVGEWLYRDVAGIGSAEDRPGYEHVVIAPHPEPRLAYAGAEYESIRGRIASRWERRAGGIALTVTIPANTTATVHLRRPEGCRLLESGEEAASAPGVSRVVEHRDEVVVEIMSGSYTFETSPPTGAGTRRTE